MGVILAKETLRKIDSITTADQGNSFRHFLQKVLPHIGDAYRQDDEGHRSHMGASLIGEECARSIWYNFRWATKATFPAQIIRLFNRGHLEEGRFIAILLSIGCVIYQQDENGKQFRISHASGHFGGSGDGVVINLPDLVAGQAALSEFKTHNQKSFDELAGKDWKKYLEGLCDPRKPQIKFSGKGVRDAKFTHYVQMQTYMRKMGLAVALYMAVNKNTDEVYAEIVMLDVAIADQFLDRGEKLVWMDKPPEKINKSPGFFKCQWCDHKPVCHLSAKPDRNCRTCEFSTPQQDATWYCAKFSRPIPKEVQLTGCQEYTQKRDF